MIIDIYNPPQDKKYKVLLADPPWKNNKGGRKNVRPNSSGGELEYETLSFREIREHLLQAQSLCEDDHILFLWTIDKYLFEAQELAESLGYKLHARMVWNKVTGIPSAFTIRYGHEYLLYMYKGKFVPVCKEYRGKYHTVFTEKVRKHSQKPVFAYNMINNLYGDVPKLELYARNEWTGFDCWGNEV